jgi:hypothetical protein
MINGTLVPPTDHLSASQLRQDQILKVLPGVAEKNITIFYYLLQCCGPGAGAGAGSGGAATFCWSRSQSFLGPAPEPGI